QGTGFVMKFSTGFGVLVLAVATTAAAQPRQGETTARLSYNEKKEVPAQAPRGDGEVVELASPTTAKHGREYIDVGSTAGQFSQLRVDGARGKVVVHKVRIDFTDGSTKYVTIDRVLKKGQSAKIELKAPKAIDRLVVTTDRQPAGESAVNGRSGGAGPARRERRHDPARDRGACQRDRGEVQAVALLR